MGGAGGCLTPLAGERLTAQVGRQRPGSGGARWEGTMGDGGSP